MTIIEKINLSVEKALELNKEESAIYILMEDYLKLSSTEMFLSQDKKMTDDEVKGFDELLNKYLYDNIPVQYLTNKAIFYGYDFYVDESVLIPRCETEELVENVLYLYDKYFKNKKVDVIDIGTGSGCIAITLAKEEKNMNVSASDISDVALNIAKKNNELLKANVNFFKSDMLKQVEGKYDILVSNPPYIPDKEEVDSLVKDNEPNIALFGGEDGLKFYKIILEESGRILKDKCILAFEHGYDKGEEIRNIAKTYFKDALIFTKNDLQGKERMTFVVRGFENE